jgi:hypothetical protein
MMLPRHTCLCEGDVPLVVSVVLRHLNAEVHGALHHPGTRLPAENTLSSMEEQEKQGSYSL